MAGDLIRVGLNGWGQVVLFCDGCKETFAGVEGMLLTELQELAQNHKCEVTGERS
jgi:hypothetical protein